MTLLGLVVLSHTPKRAVRGSVLSTGLACAWPRPWAKLGPAANRRSGEHTPELQSPCNLVCPFLLSRAAQRHPPSFPTRRSSDLAGVAHGELAAAVFVGLVGHDVVGIGRVVPHAETRGARVGVVNGLGLRLAAALGKAGAGGE